MRGRAAGDVQCLVCRCASADAACLQGLSGANWNAVYDRCGGCNVRQWSLANVYSIGRNNASRAHSAHRIAVWGKMNSSTSESTISGLHLFLRSTFYVLQLDLFIPCHKVPCQPRMTLACMAPIRKLDPQAFASGHHRHTQHTEHAQQHDCLCRPGWYLSRALRHQDLRELFAH